MIRFKGVRVFGHTPSTQPSLLAIFLCEVEIDSVLILKALLDQ